MVRRPGKSISTSAFRDCLGLSVTRDWPPVAGWFRTRSGERQIELLDLGFGSIASVRDPEADAERLRVQAVRRAHLRGVRGERLDESP